MRTIVKSLLASAICLSAATAASASSPDAWEEFRADVEKACVAATADQLSEPAAWVDPFGSESYGIAIVSGRVKRDDSAQISFICVYTKETGAVELSGEIAGDLVQKASESNPESR